MTAVQASLGHPPVAAPATDAVAGSARTDWTLLYRVAAAAALLSAALIPVQVAIFLVWPPPDTVTGYFALFESNWLLGLLSLDLLYLLNNALVVLMYLGFYAALGRFNPSALAIALTLGLLGMAAYYASNVAFEMLSLSSQYGAAAGADRSVLLAAGQGLLATYKGTAFDVYYVLSAIALLIFAVVMLRSRTFGRSAAYAGLAAGVLMVIPSTAGAPGMIFALASLVPWVVFCVLVALRLFQFARDASE